MSVTSVYIKGSKLRVPFEHPHYSGIKFMLTLLSSDGDLKRLYDIDYDTQDLIIRRGLLPLMLKSTAIDKSDIVDESPHEIIDAIQDISDLESDLLPGITLRPEQELAIRRSLQNHRGLIQAATGAGKTYMICGILKYLIKKLEYIPNALIIVPTQFLMEEFQRNLEEVGIPSKIYSDCRGEIDGIVVAHPMSINNDLDKDVLDFSKLKILIGDEAHHTSCTTWTRVFDSAENAEIVLGFSASIVDSRRLPINKISELHYDEALVYSSTGEILLDVPPSFYTDGSVLAKCCVARISNLITESVKDPKNWHQIRANQLESDNRSRMICEIASGMAEHGLKSLILINTQKHGFKLLEIFESLGIADRVACSYGSKKYYQIKNGEVYNVSSDTMDRFKSGDLQILIGTSHIYEGVDIPSLDSVIMAVVGKNNRRIIQGVGRSLRRTKNGQYAYVIDFVDYGSGVLAYHSRSRRSAYCDLIGVPETRIFDGIDQDGFFNLLTNIETNGIELD